MISGVQSLCFPFPPKNQNTISSWRSSSASSAQASLGTKRSSNSSVLFLEEAKDRIRKLFHHVDVSVSSYDTAWLALVPHPHSLGAPLFRGCVDWLVENQLQDGSWRLPHHHPLLLKDVLSSTLASVLALNKWGVADEQVHKGVRFIQLNIASAFDDYQLSPIGFDIIFPGMLEYAVDFDLNLHLDSNILIALHRKRDLELRRCYQCNSRDSEEYLAYISEGLVRLQNWDKVMNFQRKNGSLCNSPSATAAAFMHIRNPDCLHYLHSVVDKFGPAVPAVEPLEIYARLCLVANLDRLGISRHFRDEIQNVLDDTYSCWQQGDDVIFAEASTCAIAFQLLRKHGYDISADPLTKFVTHDGLVNSFGGYWRDTREILEMYRASELIIDQNESDLEKQYFWSKNILKDRISNNQDFKMCNSQVHNEVENILKLPSYASLQRVTSRKNIEHYDLDDTRILKTSYWSSNFGNKDILSLAVEDYNDCQTIHREELKQLERWVAENRLDQLKFARQKSAYCYFSAAGTLFSPELTDARMSWAKNGVLTTVVDDFFDIGGSIEELRDLINMVEKWNVEVSNDHCSEPVSIIYSALRSTIIDIGKKALKWQGRDVTSHVVEIWLDLLRSMLREAEWARETPVPTMDEYMANAYISFALGPIILPTLYLVGPKLSEEVAKGAEMHLLFKLVSTCGRILNDIQSFERESKDGKLSALSLRLIEGGDAISEAAAIAEMKSLVESQRRELLRLVVQGKGSVVPRGCKDLFWNMSKVLNQFYIKDDGFTSHELIELVNSIIHEPLPSTNTF